MHNSALLPVASRTDGRHPRPQLLRATWQDLSGPWRFRFDDDDRGLAENWHQSPAFSHTITVPFPPESANSGVHDPSPHRVMWYHRVVTVADLEHAGQQRGHRMMLRFGAVDYRATVWVNGQQVGTHEGGHTPFWFDVTQALRPDGDNDVVVRVEDDPADVAQPRGKQDWQTHPHVIWYHRTSGIWQPVWLEAVPALAVDWAHWRSRLATGEVCVRVGLSGPLDGPVAVDVEVRYGDTVLGRVVVHTSAQETDITLTLPVQTNGQAYEELLWTPENPRLLDATIQVLAQDGDRLDAVASYLGLRSAEVKRCQFLLNDRPRYIRSVLNQGYWSDTHLAAPSTAALRDEVQMMKDLGFNATRLHQKFEDPRFLYWADRLGLMVWSEAPATFTFTATSMQRTIREWLEVVHRDVSHPSIVTWVPLNESWGVQHIAHDPRMRHFARSLVDLTKALDGTRPVVSNDGWEQVDTDIVAIHDYEGDGDVLRARYRDRAAVDRLLGDIGPAGRQLILSGDVSDAPVMLTEFGGISFDVTRTDDAWGYTAATTAEDFGTRLRALMNAVHDSTVLAGYCYTQFTDTLQETNGLLTADRIPKLPVDEIRAAMLGPRPSKSWE